MPKLLQPALNGGELSPSLYARVDLARYGTHVKYAKNFICRQYGGMVNRPGFGRAEITKNLNDSNPEANPLYDTTRVLPFIFSQDIAYVVVLGSFYARFIYNGDYVRDGSNNIVEITTPWAISELFDIRYTQSADKLYMVHPDHAPRVITRVTSNSFTIAEIETKDGPFRRINSDEAIVVAASAQTGNVTITANSSIFTADMVGGYFYIESKNLGKVKPWTVGDRGVAVGDLRRSDGKTYKAVTVPTGGGATWTECGSFRPVHETGRYWDGGGDVRTDGTNTWIVGIEWEYQDSSYGVVRVTGYTSGTQVSAIVTRKLPADVVGGAGAPVNTWNLVGDDVTVQFAIAGATAVSSSFYSVTIDGQPVQSDPYYPGGSGRPGNDGTVEP